MNTARRLTLIASGFFLNAALVSHAHYSMHASRVWMAALVLYSAACAVCLWRGWREG